eukprot:TRINITY_DN986_c0_g1_i10.p1 TRINITY_DN986_c0_g1~~TRINITY_DN986_c0_g1_i10.p1  ORF type:complete len:387 (+),score=16.38 TRINITY_DN986_c0_g1_i10:262-1422(+)
MVGIDRGSALIDENHHFAPNIRHLLCRSFDRRQQVPESRRVVCRLESKSLLDEIGGRHLVARRKQQQVEQCSHTPCDGVVANRNFEFAQHAADENLDVCSHYVERIREDSETAGKQRGTDRMLFLLDVGGHQTQKSCDIRIGYGRNVIVLPSNPDAMLKAKQGANGVRIGTLVQHLQQRIVCSFCYQSAGERGQLTGNTTVGAQVHKASFHDFLEEYRSALEIDVRRAQAVDDQICSKRQEAIVISGLVAKRVGQPAVKDIVRIGFDRRSTSPAGKHRTTLLPCKQTLHDYVAINVLLQPIKFEDRFEQGIIDQHVSQFGGVVCFQPDRVVDQFFRKIHMFANDLGLQRQQRDEVLGNEPIIEAKPNVFACMHGQSIDGRRCVLKH